MENELSIYEPLLAAYKAPTIAGKRIPYSLWGRLCRTRMPDGQYLDVPDLAELRLIGSHKHPEKAIAYQQMGWKLLKFWAPESDPEFKDVLQLMQDFENLPKARQALEELEAEKEKTAELQRRVDEMTKKANKNNSENQAQK